MGNAKHETANFRYFSEIGGERARYAPYYGRGYFQLTWRANYAEYGRALGVDLVNNPNLASGKNLSARIAVEYWKRRVSRFNPSTNLEAGGLGINGNEKRLYPRRWANRQAAVRSYLSDPRLSQ
jgi:predicted chitinase